MPSRGRGAPQTMSSMSRELGASHAPETEQCWPALRRVHGEMLKTGSLGTYYCLHRKRPPRGRGRIFFLDHVFSQQMICAEIKMQGFLFQEKQLL